MTQAWTSWPAPAKLNLFLHIVGRRSDGYHLLQTVFQLLDWGDTVRLRTRADGEIARSNDVPGVAPESDLCLRAAHALREHSGSRMGVDIALDKRIPLGGGLGGGSSDAATVLVALNDLWSAGLSPDELAGIALDLGADVPVFVRGYSAWAEGVGEKLTPIALRQRHYVIVDPGISVATAALFQAPELTRNSPPLTISDYLSGSGAGTTNAFTPIARAGYPPLAAALDWLGQFGEARLTGSGGCIFVDVESAERADEIAEQCPLDFTVYQARGVDRSPLLDALEHNRRPA
ncbi:MAG TPA: 4-(cytidine 5'-diphospho)-2-C-methyl-D-erythritol kinase [Rudaea sp.]|nr:4-(cytidine 5'-diphospho)-2-C-methyl-D-erythritol kinase [Rudaea sp.]HSC12134.1 4-(cytidine 5'-diphospho)-2-C-methyl-D-erythritol kinase [Rhodanobacteraceae bacterium]